MSDWDRIAQALFAEWGKEITQWFAATEKTRKENKMGMLLKGTVLQRIREWVRANEQVVEVHGDPLVSTGELKQYLDLLQGKVEPIEEQERIDAGRTLPAAELAALLQQTVPALDEIRKTGLYGANSAVVLMAALTMLKEIYNKLPTMTERALKQTVVDELRLLPRLDQRDVAGKLRTWVPYEEAVIVARTARVK